MTCHPNVGTGTFTKISVVIIQININETKMTMRKRKTKNRDVWCCANSIKKNKRKIKRNNSEERTHTHTRGTHQENSSFRPIFFFFMIMCRSVVYICCALVDSDTFEFPTRMSILFFLWAKYCWLSLGRYTYIFLQNSNNGAAEALKMCWMNFVVVVFKIVFKMRIDGRAKNAGNEMTACRKLNGQKPMKYKSEMEKKICSRFMTDIFTFDKWNKLWFPKVRCGVQWIVLVNSKRRTKHL